MKKLSAVVLFSVFVLSVRAVVVQEKFAADPLQNGWQIFGDTNLFRWDSTNQGLAVTWDSSQTNSYFYHPLGATFTKADSFCLLFDMTLADVNATNYFQLAIGLCNYAEASSAGFSRANVTSPDLFEFDYFPDGANSYGPSMDATLVDADAKFYFAYDDTQPMANGVTYRVILVHRAGESSVTGTVFTNGQVFTALPKMRAYGADDFKLDTLAVCNYTTADDIYGDSLLAHGTVDNLAFASPLPVDQIRAMAPGQIRFDSDTHWLYTLETSVDLQTWTVAAPPVAGNGTNLALQATNAHAEQSFYRVRADLP